MILMMEDSLCPSELNEYIFSAIPTPEKYIRFEHGDHFMFSFDLTEGEIDRMVETIETGTVHEEWTSFSFLSWK